MSVLTITCDNCGAKYRLPESFSSDKAKCKKCQGVIDVAAQRTQQQDSGAERKPAAAARPARTRPAATSKPTSERSASSKSRRSSGASQRKRGEASESKETSGSRRRSRKAPQDQDNKKKNFMLMGIGGALVLIGILAVAFWPGDDKETTTENTAQASNQSNETSKPAQPAEQPTADATSQPAAGQPAEAAEAATEPTEETPDPAAATANDQETEQAAADSNASDSAETKPAAAQTKPASASGGLSENPNDGNTERWMKNSTTSMAEVLDTKTLGDVSWPESATAEIQSEINGLLDSISDGGLAGIRAKPKLETIGYFAIYGIIDRLRKLDYTDADDNMTAWELNKVLETITAGLNTGFAAVNVGENLDPRKADYNAKTTKAWTRLIENPQLADEASFTAWRKKRLQRK